MPRSIKTNKSIRVFLLQAWIVGCLSACSSMSTPVLRHETGETLAPGQARAGIIAEASRLYLVAPLTSGITSVAQDSAVLRGSLLGAYGSFGVPWGFELGARTYFALAGGGWRASVKRNVVSAGALAVATQVGYGQYVGRGTVTYATTASTIDVTQVLSARQIELSAPVSYKMGAQTWVYSGITYYKTNIVGAASDTGMSTSEGDIGFNLGLRMGFGTVQFDIETAMLKASSELTGQSQMLPYFGFAGGITF